MLLNRLSGNQAIRLSATLLSFILLLFSSADAAPLQRAPRFYGQEVVVTGSRIPQPKSKLPWNTTVIAKEELEQYRTVAEALKSIAGVDAKAYGSLGSVSSIRLRGANASQVLVMIDGRRINSPTLGMFDLNDILLDNVEKIEVVRSPLSAVYGSDAVTGAINIITKTIPDAERSVSAASGSFGTEQYSFSYSGANYLVCTETLKSAGFRQNSDYLANNFSGKLFFQTTAGQLFLDYSRYEANKGIPGVPTSEADPYSSTEPNDRQRDRNTFVSTGLKGKNFTARIYQNILDQELGPYIFGASTNEALQTGIEWLHNFDLGSDQMTYGFEAREDRGKNTMTGEHTIRNYATFLQDIININEKCTLTAGIRGDKHSTAGTSINPRVGVVYEASPSLLLRASAGTSFRAPTLNELYWNDGYSFGDTGLKPEKSFSYDIGLERKISGSASARLSYYVSTVTDLILWDWRSSTLECRAKNVGEAYFEGIEFELTQKLGDMGKGFVNMTYQSAIDKKDFDPLAVDKRISYAPALKYNAGLTFGGLSVAIRHVGERYADQYNTVTLAPYTVVDAKLTRKLGGFILTLAVDNLFDENYSEAVGNDPTTFAARNYPMPGRSFSCGVKWEF